MEQKNEKKGFSPEELYQEGLSDMTDVSRLQEFLTFYASYAGSMTLENTILLWKQKTALPEEYHTLEEWNADNRKVIYGEISHLRLYAPENYHGRTEEHDGRQMIALFHTQQTVQSAKFHRDTAEHPFVFTAHSVPSPTDELLLQTCVDTALSCMQTMKCGMPVFEEPGQYVTLDDPVRYDPGSNRLYIAKGASYDTVAHGLLRETLFCKLYQPDQKYPVYESNRFQASCAAQIILHQLGVTKSFPVAIPSREITAKEVAQCLSSIPSGVQSMRQDFAWIQKQLHGEQTEQKEPTEQTALKKSAPKQMQQNSNVTASEAVNAAPPVFDWDDAPIPDWDDVPIPDWDAAPDMQTPENSDDLQREAAALFADWEDGMAMQEESFGDSPKKEPMSVSDWDTALDFQDLQNVSAAGRQRGDEIGI